MQGNVTDQLEQMIFPKKMLLKRSTQNERAATMIAQIIDPIGGLRDRIVSS
jgi:hypothetical protein